MKTELKDVRVCAAVDVSPGTAKRFNIEHHRLAVVHIGDSWYVIGDRCSHADVSLASGDVLADECAIECWKHGSTFSLLTGEAQTLPATKPVPVYDVELRAGHIYVSSRPGSLDDE